LQDLLVTVSLPITINWLFAVVRLLENDCSFISAQCVR